MRKLKFIWIVLSALMLAGACSRLDEQKAALNIYVRLPEDAATKAAYTDWSTLFSRETRINDLKIWVFLNESTDASLPAGLLLGYLEPKQLNVVSGSVQKFTVLLDKEVASKIKKVDVYVLANSRAIQMQEIGKTTTSAELEALTLSGNRFGIADNGAPTNTGIVDYEGLPYTAMGKGLTLSGSGSNLSLDNEKLELVRAVSKIQFVFSQIKLSSGETPVPFSINWLELNGGQIPEQEYLFNDSANKYKIGNEYVTRTLTFPVPSKDEIVGNTNPSSYVRDSSNETPQEYQARIYEALVNNTLTGYAPCYLRESDKALTGKINYTLGTFAPKTLDFSMNPNEKFTRNSSWVLYFYINNNALSLSVSYADWTSDGSYTIIGR